MQPFEVLPPGSPGTPPPPKRNLLQIIGGWVTAAVVAVVKFKFLLFAVLKTCFSMFLMIGLYALLFGWKFAAGIVLMIFLHELGHVIVSLYCGIPVTGMMFVPFFGAYVTRARMAPDAWTGALIAYGGPAAGFFASWFCLWLGIHWEKDWIIAVASISFWINIFNMIPAPPLDGGYICAAISRSFWIFGLILLGASLFYFHYWLTSIIIIGLVVMVTLPMMRDSLFGAPTEEMEAYYNTHISKRITMAIMYVGLIGLLLLGYMDSSERLSHLNSPSEETTSSDN